MFLDFPLDIHIEILFQLEFLDISNLFKTCTKLAVLSKSERFWLSLLTRNKTQAQIQDIFTQFQNPEDLLVRSVKYFPFSVELTYLTKVSQIYCMNLKFTKDTRLMLDTINSMGYGNDKKDKIKELSKHLVKNKDIFLLPFHDGARSVYRPKLRKFIQFEHGLACLIDDYKILYGSFD